MGELDIVVTGVDPARPRSEVIAGLARRLGKSVLEIEDALESVPVTLARASSIAQAEQLALDLRLLGAEVKALDPPGGERIDAAAPDAPRARPPLVFWSPEEDGYDRPRPVSPHAETVEAATPSVPSRPAERPPLGDPVKPPAPILVRSSHEWFGSGASSRAPSSPGAASTPLASPAAKSFAARFGRSERRAPPRGDAPRVFFRALPDAVRLPLRRPLLLGMTLAPLLAATTIVLGVIGLGAGEAEGPLCLALAVMAATGFLGLVHQIADACLGAALSGATIPSGLPGRLMQDYVIRGGLVLAVLAVLFTAATFAADELIRMRATLLTMSLFWCFVALYASLGLGVAAAGGSAFGYLDLARITRLFVRAPLHTLFVASTGALLIGGAVLAGVSALAAVMELGAPLAVALDAGALGLAVSTLATYGAGLTGATMGLLLRVRPEAWHDE